MQSAGSMTSGTPLTSNVVFVGTDVGRRGPTDKAAGTNGTLKIPIVSMTSTVPRVHFEATITWCRFLWRRN